MNKRLMKNSPQTIGGVLVLIILTCAGMFLYARRDLRRFKEQSRVSPAAPPRTKKVINTYTEEPPLAETAAPKPLKQHNMELESDGLEIETPSLETLDSLIDELALSEVEPSEAETVGVQDESFEEEVDSGSSLASLISSLERGNVDIGSGAPEDLATVVEMLKRAAKGPMAVDDLITMIEAWLRIQPDTPHMQSEINETRYSLINMLSWLRAEKEKSLQSGKEIKHPIRIYYSRF